MIQEFGRNLTDMVSGMLEAMQALFAQLRDLEAGYTEQVTELALHVLEKVIRNDEDVDMPQETTEVRVTIDTEDNRYEEIVTIIEFHD